MARRRLNRRQSERVSAIVQRRRERSTQTAQAEADSRAENGLGEAQEGLVIARYGANLVVESAEGGLYACTARQNLGDLVCGDRVVWQASGNEAGVITADLPRFSVLERHGYHGATKPLAANVDQLVIVSAPLPELSAELIDRYLVASRFSGIPPLLVLTKTDLLSTEALGTMESRLGEFRAIGYPVIYASVRRPGGLEEVIAHLKERTSVLVGQSGVGKSSLIDALLPDHKLHIGAVSQASGLGRHTTSAATLYHLPCGGNLIDSPGVRNFHLWDLPPEELAEGYVELAPLAGHCRFANCAHGPEPGCAFRQAVRDGHVSQRRLDSYLQLRSALERARLDRRVR
ncbi:MAG: small ribosomal subunit biogenesis GTPase RsgA [Chromatiales bacterium]|nr:small ribosomal subunit biogenesis GTPase RsgA [Chromatiales bacterium]